MYGEAKALSIAEIKPRARSSKGNRGGFLLERTPLHAASLEFPEGILLQSRFEAPLPKDMRATITQLAKWLPDKSAF